MTNIPENNNPPPKTGESPGDSPSRSRPRSPKAVNPQRRSAAPRRLSETRGPEPATPITNVKLAVGTIGGTHGVQGELKLHLLTDHPEHLATIEQVFLGTSDEPTRLLGIRFHGGGALIRLEGITTPEEGQALGGLAVRIRGEDAKPLAEGEYFLFQLIGLTVFDEAGEEIGVVTDLMETGAHDVLVVQPRRGGDDILVPNHPEYVIAIEPEAGRLVLRLPVYE
jgi:16S rRNA processing protein RimM